MLTYHDLHLLSRFIHPHSQPDFAASHHPELLLSIIFSTLCSNLWPTDVSFHPLVPTLSSALCLFLRLHVLRSRIFSSLLWSLWLHPLSTWFSLYVWPPELPFTREPGKWSMRWVTERRKRKTPPTWHQVFTDYRRASYCVELWAKQGTHCFPLAL